MDRTFYALLVGINEYPEPRHRLDGCVNDVTRMEEFLRARLDTTTGFLLESPVKLLNEQATRPAVIEAFRGTLGRARQGDVALFYYSGHGSQERAPKEFWHLEPDRLDETLVCYDSRLDKPGCYDLADKELAYLIEQVAKNGAHVVIILDSCHSGSGTRNLSNQGTKVRRVETDLRDRPLDSFIMKVQDADRVAGVQGAAGWSASGRHILLAACRDNEEAVECLAVGADGKVEPRGTFSYFLGEALRGVSGPITYRELFAHTDALVRERVMGQSPQIECADPGDLDGLIFDGVIRPAQPFYTLSRREERWQIDAGAVHGLPPADPGEPTLLDIYSFDVSDDDLRNPSKAHAAARVAVAKVEPTFSVVEVSDDAGLDPARAYKALIAALPLPRIGVELEPFGSQGADLARTALETAQPGSPPSPSLYVREAGPGATARYRLIAIDGGYVITSPENDRPLVARIEGLSPATARMAVSRLEHMARWSLTAELNNPSTSVRPEDIALVLVDEDGQDLRGPDIRLEYRLEGNKWVAPKFKIRLKNQTKSEKTPSGRVLYFGLLDLRETFEISPVLESGSVKLGPDDEPYEAFQGQYVAATVPDKLWQQGVVEYKDILKLIVATQEFDVRLMKQGALDLPSTKSVTRGLAPRGGSLNRLMDRIQTRDLGRPSAGDELDDWWATQVTFTTVRPLEATPVPNAPGRSVSLAGGVRLLDHPTLKAHARLSPGVVTSRSLGNLALPRLLRDDPSISLPFTLAATRGHDSGLSTLVLTGVEGDGYKAVTPDSPLRLLSPRTLPDGDFVLPVGFDGEFFLPLGRAVRLGSATELVLERLPAPTPDTKSLGASIKVFFQKIVGPWVGKPSEHPILAAVDIDQDGGVTYVKELEVIRKRVGSARNILLYVHGIIGDTREMAGSAALAGFAGRYDAILTFDYENLGTSIGENARLLGERLAAVGVSPGGGRRLDIVAHSMGGLVSRWFIEMDRGNEVVRKLVMLGTPNAGSPWPRLVDWATVAMALGLNGLTGSPWPARVLRGLTASLGDPRVSLQEMIPGSETLTKLGKSPDPGVPYTILTGNTSAIQAEAGPDGAVSRLLGRLLGTNPLYAVANPFFHEDPNDIAVSIKSMTAVPGHPPTAVTVACDHITYFSSKAGLAELSKAL